MKVGGTTQDVVAHTILMAQKHYRKLLEEGVAPEMARMILPQNTMTEGTGLVRSTPLQRCAANVSTTTHNKKLEAMASPDPL